MNSRNHIACLCFSKDRPMQLEAYIRSVFKYFSVPPELTVLFKTSDDKFYEAYLRLQKMFPEVNFVAEVNFRRHISHWLKNISTPLLMFGCDDVIFHRRINSDHIFETFKNPELLGFSLRLGLNISYSATGRKPMPKPHFIETKTHLLWDWRTAKDSWAYPFELDCTVYRKQMLEKFIEFFNNPDVHKPLFGKDISGEWGHPNRLEPLGCGASELIKDQLPLLASFTEAKGIVITVNRVQNEIKNFVYDKEDSFTTEKLLRQWMDSAVIDIDDYNTKTFRATHIPDIFLCRRENTEEKINLKSCDIFEVMICDFIEKLKKSDSPLLLNARLSDFVKKFYNYFHMQGAENELPVTFEPCFNGRDEMPEFSVPREWCRKKYETVKENNLEVLNAFDMIDSAGLAMDFMKSAPSAALEKISELKNSVRNGGIIIASLHISDSPFICFDRCRVFSRKNAFQLFEGFEIMEEAFFDKNGSLLQACPEQIADLEYCLWCFQIKRIR